MGRLEKPRSVIGLRIGDGVERVLCVGAHPDDIEIGAFGLVTRMAKANADILFDFVVLTGEGARTAEAEASMKKMFGDRATMHNAGFRDGYLPYDDPSGVKDFIRAAAADHAPQVVVCPSEGDRHQDHDLLARLVPQVFRDQLVVQYEIAKYDGDLGRPNAFVGLSEREVDAKISHIAACFPSQRSKDWFSDSGFRALMQLRGIESKSPSGFAEGFYVQKFCLE